jgi:hypothetical protein
MASSLVEIPSASAQAIKTNVVYFVVRPIAITVVTTTTSMAWLGT